MLPVISCHSPEPLRLKPPLPSSLQTATVVLCPPATVHTTLPVCTYSIIAAHLHPVSSGPPQFSLLSAGSFLSPFKNSLSDPPLPSCVSSPAASLPLLSFPERDCLYLLPLPRFHAALCPMHSALLPSSLPGNFSLQSQQRPACNSTQRPRTGSHSLTPSAASGQLTSASLLKPSLCFHNGPSPSLPSSF